MEMRLRLPELLKSHGMTPYAVAKADERISLSALYRLVRSNGRVRYLDTILVDALMDVFGIGPAELIEREKPKRKAG